MTPSNRHRVSFDDPIFLGKGSQIETLFFKDPCIIDRDIEGTLIEPDGGLVFGMRAGPIDYPASYTLSNLFHEMSHFVEIDDRRMAKPGFGLKTPEILFVSNYGYEIRDSFKTDQHIQRELRVMAYQLNMLEWL